jgi:signal transduction histidine kinase
LSATIRHDNRNFYLEITDNGKGFDPVTTGAQALGLLGMRERARDLGAELTVISAPGAGVQLRLQLPMV